MLKTTVIEDAGARKRQALITACIIASYFLLPLLIYLNYFITNTMMFDGDYFSWMNMKSLFVEGFQAGDPVLWNKYSMLGTPYIADIQNAFFYPLNYLALLMPLTVFANVFYVASLGLAGTFMYLYMNELQKNKVVSFVAGIIFALSIILGERRVAHHNVYSTVIWLPLVLLFIQRYIRTNRRKEILFASAVMAVQFMAGFPQVMLYCCIFVFLYLVIFMDKGRQYLKQRIVDIVLWLVLFLALTAVMLGPQIELMRSTGRAEVSYGFFSVLSADYRILPMILFPHLYPNSLQPFGVYNSAELSHEIYTGVIVAVFLVYAAIYHLKDKKIRVFFIFCVAALAYCMIGNIPVLGQLIYRIPILGSFRVASRMMFIYVFFAIAIFGLILGRLKDRQEAKRLFRFSLIMLGVIIAIAAVSFFVGIADPEVREYYGDSSIFTYQVLFAACLVGVMAAYCYLKFFYESRHAFVILAVALCVINVLDVGRLSMNHLSVEYPDKETSDGFYDAEYIEAQPGSSEYRSFGVVENVPEFVDREKALLYKANENMRWEIGTYNSYITFENKNANRFMGIAEAYIPAGSTQILTHNFAFSVTSHKYIADPYRNVTGDKVYVRDGDFMFTLPETDIPANEQAGEAAAVTAPVEIEPRAYYYIQFEAETETPPYNFYLDFQGEGYDQAECQVSVPLQAGDHKYKTVLFSGDYTLPDVVNLRIITEDSAEIILRNFKMVKLTTVPFDEVYKKVVDNEETVMYENQNARPVVNIAGHVRDISGMTDLGEVDTSYLPNPPRQLDTPDGTASAELLEWGNNHLTAKVQAEQEVFLNYTQSTYPGWRVYIDGQQAVNYIVNGVTQGTYVPAGEHTVEFRFEPRSFYLGAVVTGIGIVLLVLLIRRDNKKHKGTGKTEP